MISTIRIAYKVGFSSALSFNVISAYMEMAKYKFVEDRALRRRVMKAFCRGFDDAHRMFIATRREVSPVSYNFLEPAHKLLFS